MIHFKCKCGVYVYRDEDTTGRVCTKCLITQLEINVASLSGQLQSALNSKQIGKDYIHRDRLSDIKAAMLDANEVYHSPTMAKGFKAMKELGLIS